MSRQVPWIRETDCESDWWYRQELVSCWDQVLCKGKEEAAVQHQLIVAM